MHSFLENKEQNMFVVQAARILANLLVMGSGIMVRALSQAYGQALASMFLVNSSFGHWDFYLRI